MTRLLALSLAALAAPAFVHAQPTATNGWNVTLGAGVISAPEYPGSDDQKVQAVPVLAATHGRWSLGALPAAGVPFGVGYQFVQTSQWRFGLAVGSGFSNPREESDDPRLAGLGDIDSTAQLSAFGSFTERWGTVRASVTTDIGGNDQGTVGLLDLEGRLAVSDRLTLTAGPGIGFSDRRHQQTFFGIDTAQSLASGRPEYRPSGGLHALRFAVGGDYRFTPQWGLGARAVFTKLRGDAADSPITQDSQQNAFSVFTTYRF